MKYAKIIVNISHENLDKTYEYAIPEEWETYAVIGAQVLIPFGARNRQIKGFILGITRKPEFPPERIKSIIKVIMDGTVIEGHFIQLAAWMRTQYGSTMNDALRTVLPVKKTVKEQKEQYLHRIIDRERLFEYMEECERKHYTARYRLAVALEDQEVISYKEALEELNISRDVIRKFVDLGIISISSRRQYRNPIKEQMQIEKKISLTPKQQRISNEIWQEYQAGIRNTYLIRGVTGSGKTEVYFDIIERVVKDGKQVIFLIPEIALTVAMVERFHQRFGERVSVLHSKLSDGERFDQYERAKAGELDIMIGPRLALFTPFPELGLILLDEEHEPSYKSEAPPKYHAREVALQRAKMCNASVILGSATPSVESYYKAQCGEYKLFTLNERVGESRIPDISIVDLRKELKARNFSIFSRSLREKIQERLERKEQILLFLNRRGYAGFISCRQCGFVLECPHCQISLTEHNNGKMMCHYCGYETIKPSTCPSCGSKYIASFGTGTQKVEEYARKEFPNARILRMDRDTTSRKGAYEEILKAFERQEADILIGTQMIGKGHDFNNVTLVGALAADLSLFANDYRASERTFQLLCQVAGRAGRRERHGEAVIQTYQPEHYSIIAAKKQDYEEFYRQEITYRKLLQYPPLGHLLAILLVSLDEKQVEKASILLTEAAKEKMGEKVIGPANAYHYRLKDRYRKVIYLKESDLEALLEVKNYLEGFVDYSNYFQKVNVYFDRNPLTMY
ncbi:MAG: primosomal protein N' [Lachnospiraceae bacterium]|nr:primosomal protein N' [Lachnospiraceae bacterium]